MGFVYEWCLKGEFFFPFSCGCSEMKQKGLGESVGKVVVVAVKASKEIPRSALMWALTHVVQPGDCIKFLVVTPALPSGNLLNLSCYFYKMKNSSFC